MYNAQDSDKFYTYKHYKADDNTVFYVGKGKLDRCLHRKDRSQWWYNTVNKHGYYIIIDEINLTEEQAFAREKELVSIYGRKQYGGLLINLTDGGEGVSGKIFTEEERQQKSIYMKNHPEQWAECIGKKAYGEDNPNYGNRGSKNPMAKHVYKCDLQGNLIKEYNSLVEAAEENNTQGSSISAVCLGKRHQLKGFFWTYDLSIKPKLGSTNKKPVLQIDKNTLEVIKEYPSSRATKDDGFCPSKVNAVCNGTRKTSGGFIWRFKTN